MAVYTYNVITDTHGYPWGSNYAADFDLGDNTPSYPGTFQEEPHAPSNPRIRILGNHDASYYVQKKETGFIKAYKPFKPYTMSGRSAEKIAFFGLNTVADQNVYTIPQSEISALAQELEDLNNIDIAVLTHVPLFKPTTDRNTSQETTGECYGENELEKWGSRWDSEAEEVIKMLQSYQNHSTYNYKGVNYNFSNSGRVIGCFCGHIHNHVQCYYKGIYMESFSTNGEDQWTSSRQIENRGLYTPPVNTISVDLTSRKVNGNSYVNTVNNGDTHIINIENQNSGTAIGSSAIGTKSLDGFYPKFYNGIYVGYSSRSSAGITSRNNINGWFTVEDGTYIQGLQQTVKFIRFDASGKLRYYKTFDDKNDISNYIEIPGYDSTALAFSSDNCLWKFNNGLFVSAESIYKSGKLVGKNGYSIVFNANGYATAINDGSKDNDYTAGENWVNVNEFTVYWRPFTDYTNKETSTNTPQIGIEGNFGSGARIDLARSTKYGKNWIPSRYNVLIRIVGGDNKVYWLYDGRLTNLTDAKVGI